MLRTSRLLTGFCRQLQRNTRNASSATQGLLERLNNNEQVFIAEGYLMEFERRCYVQAGSWAPNQIVLQHPDVLAMTHEEFVRAGSDVVQAYTYYGHREKMKQVGSEDTTAALNRKAIDIAREIARNHGKLLAAGLSDTMLWRPDSPATDQKLADMFQEQVEWFVDGEVDYIISETVPSYGEAKLQLEAIKKHGKGRPAVITLAQMGFQGKTFDDIPYEDACKKLEDDGADVVGLNCSNGITTMLPLIEKVRAKCQGHVACVPGVYRTTNAEPTMQTLTDPSSGEPSWPSDLAPHLCSRSQVTNFAKQIKTMNVHYLGLCCGNQPHYTRAFCEALGRRPESSVTSPDATTHFSKVGNTDYEWSIEQYQKTVKKLK